MAAVTSLVRIFSPLAGFHRATHLESFILDFK
jgi:hypothetical protein